MDIKLIEEGKLINEKMYDIHGVKILCRTVSVNTDGKHILFSVVYIDDKIYKIDRVKVIDNNKK